MDAARSRGCDDLALLDSTTPPDASAIATALSVRLREGSMYTTCSELLISVNPYKLLPFSCAFPTGPSLYDVSVALKYRGRRPGDNVPHIFATTESALRALSEGRPQAIIVLGESGSGKTETCRQVLTYASAATSGASGDALHTAQRVRDRLLASNLLVEAFGNAKTVRNDNSSRFGKLTRLSVRPSGCIERGSIETFLLEQQRVCTTAPGERTFHVLHFLAAGAPAALRATLHLPSNARDFALLAGQSSGAADTSAWRALTDCSNTLGLSPAAQLDLHIALAVTLHLGNVAFEEDGEGFALVVADGTSRIATAALCALLDCSDGDVQDALCKRAINVRGTEAVHARLNVSEAHTARDTLARAVYKGAFDTLITLVNASISGEGAPSTVTTDNNAPDVPSAPETPLAALHLLDIFGFETALPASGFTQLLINVANEELHRLYVKQALHDTQALYDAEGISFSHVECIESAIGSLILGGSGGGLGHAVSILSLLDDATATATTASTSHAPTLVSPSERPSLGAAAEALLTCLDKRLQGRAGYEASGGKHVFSITHYAGVVMYSPEGFIEANADRLTPDLRSLVSRASRAPLLVAALRDMRSSEAQRHRAPTTSSTFRDSLTRLLDTLEPCRCLYVKCIVPNARKQPQAVDDALLTQQVEYHGLAEALRVSTGGYAAHLSYADVLSRFALLSSATWPPREGQRSDPKAAVITLLHQLRVLDKHAPLPTMSQPPQALQQPHPLIIPGAATAVMVAASIKAPPPCHAAVVARALGLRLTGPHLVLPGDLPSGRLLSCDIDVALGATELFIKTARTFFDLEAMREAALSDVVSRVAARWRSFSTRRSFLAFRASLVLLQSAVRTRIARAAFLRQHAAVTRIAAIVRGTIVRSNVQVSALRAMRGRCTSSHGKTRRLASMRWLSPRGGDFIGLLASSTGDAFVPAPGAERVVMALSRLSPPATLSTLSFADRVLKLRAARQWEVVRRVLVVAGSHVLSIQDDESVAWQAAVVKRVIHVCDIERVSMSPHDDSYLTLHVRGTRGYAFTAIVESKTALIAALAAAHAAVCVGTTVPKLVVEVASSWSLKAQPRDAPSRARTITVVALDAAAAEAALGTATATAHAHGLVSALTLPGGGGGGMEVAATMTQARGTPPPLRPLHEALADGSLLVRVALPHAPRLTDLLSVEEAAALRAKGWRVGQHGAGVERGDATVGGG